MPPLNAKEAENPPDAAPCRPPCADKDLHALLLQLPLFRSLNGEQLNLIAQACHLIPIARHDFVFRKGDPANGLYIVASGSVKLSLRAAKGQDKIIEFFREPDAQFITPDNPLGFVVGQGAIGFTMGQMLSLPMLVIGAVLILRSRRSKAVA